MLCLNSVTRHLGVFDLVRHSLNKNLSNRFLHNFLLAVPLAVITVFCFSFVLMQPTLSNHGKSSAGSVSNKDKSPLKPLKDNDSATFPRLETTTPPTTVINTDNINSGSGAAPVTPATGQAAPATPKATPKSAAPSEQKNQSLLDKVLHGLL